MAGVMFRLRFPRRDLVVVNRSDLDWKVVCRVDRQGAVSVVFYSAHFISVYNTARRDLAAAAVELVDR